MSEQIPSFAPTNRGLTVDDLESGKSIYVKPIAGDRTPGDINLTLHSATGQPLLVYIPRTFIPIRVTDFAPADMFIASTDFRKCVSGNYLKIIPVDEAEKILSTPEGREELERVRTEIYGGKGMTAQKEVEPMEVIDEVGNNEVTLKIKDVMIREDINDAEKLNLLRIEKDIMIKADFDFILSIVDDKSDISKWAKNVLSMGNFKKD